MNSPHRHSVLRLALVVAVSSAILAACAGSQAPAPSGTGAPSGSGAPPSQQPVESNAQDAVDAALEAGGTITYWTWTPSAEAQVKAFEKAYPKVHVNLANVGTGNEHYTKLQNVIKAGSGAPDVAQIEYNALPQFALTGGLADLKEFGFEGFASDYTPSSWELVHVNDGLYGLPQGPGQMALFYNKKVFDKDGIAVPTTWDGYLDAAKKLKAADPKSYITADNGSDANWMLGMIWQAGGRPFAVDGERITINLQDQGTQKFTSVWNQLRQGDYLAPVGPWTEEWFTGLATGTIATLPFGCWMGGNIDLMGPKVKDTWRVTTLPTYDGGQPVSAQHGGSAESVLKQSKNPALAAGFLRWLDHEAGNKLYIESGGYPDSLADIRDPAFVDRPYQAFGDEKINKLFDEIGGSVGQGWQFLPYQTYANSIFGDTVGKSYLSKSDLNAGLKAWQDALVEYGKQQGFQVSGG